MYANWVSLRTDPPWMYQCMTRKAELWKTLQPPQDNSAPVGEICRLSSGEPAMYKFWFFLVTANVTSLQYSDYATSWTTGLRFLAREGYFSLRHRVQTGTGAHPASCLMGTRGLFPWGKAAGREADRFAEIKNAWSCTATPPYVFMAWCSVLTEHHAMKTYWGSGGIALRIVDLGTRWSWVVSFTPRPLNPQGKSPWYPLNRRLGGPQNRSGSGG
jgi:hypothetical protein